MGRGNKIYKKSRYTVGEIYRVFIVDLVYDWWTRYGCAPEFDATRLSCAILVTKSTTAEFIQLSVPVSAIIRKNKVGVARGVKDFMRGVRGLRELYMGGRFKPVNGENLAFLVTVVNPHPHFIGACKTQKFVVFTEFLINMASVIFVVFFNLFLKQE